MGLEHRVGQTLQLGALEDRVGETLQDGAMEGGVWFHPAGLGFVALVLGALCLVASSDPATISSAAAAAAAACSKIAMALSLDIRAQAACHPLSYSLASSRPYPPRKTMCWVRNPWAKYSLKNPWEFPLLLCKHY
ncbi:uncharacterized protein [Triticum aestivum]|uniref:uncharacterized protein n=1 Tax=Triticum aestivum TaxID=4565 RepID=UPI001D01845A|nr:uncharacterized protein LOC123080551 [Triticum aestivum]